MSWQGMNAVTGRTITELEHIRQSVTDILTTPVGTRVMRRDYGSRIFELIDQPQNGATRLKLMAATVMALLRWEPRIAVTHMALSQSQNGRLIMDLSAQRTDSGETLTLTGIEITS